MTPNQKPTKEWSRPSPLQIIENMRAKNFREEVILEEVEKELRQASLPSNDKQGWIDVGERLPEISEDPIYLVYHKPRWEDDYPITQAGFKSIDAGIWPDAIKWMPLPPPPQSPNHH